MSHHDPDCQARTAAWQRERKVYEVCWPRHCRACGGWGGHAYRYDPSPAGVGLAAGWMWETDPCPACIERGLCPRCGSFGFNAHGEGPCCRCGWRDGTPGAPPQPECLCWLADDPA